MPYIIAVALGKGGVGKTTVANALASAAVTTGGEGARVALVDHDSQGSAHGWAAIAENAGEPLPYSVVEAPRHDLTHWVRRHGDEWDCIIIDGHPQDDDHNRAAARNAHVVVVPTQPYLADLVRVPPWLAYCASIDRYAVVVLTQVPARSADDESAREFLADVGAKVADVELSSRVGVARNYGRPPGRLLTHFGTRLLDQITP